MSHSDSKSHMDGAAASRLTNDDREFITGAAQGGMFEVESSRVALDKQASDFTKEFARMMVDDHGKSNQKLEDIVQRKKGEIAHAMSEAQSNQLNDLQSKDGADFDAAYRQAQIDAHEQAIKLFERAGRMCDDAELRAFAIQTLPTLREHRKRLDESPK